MDERRQCEQHEAVARRLWQGTHVEYWTVSEGGDALPHITHCRATYHPHTPWAQHPWSRLGGSGADFIDEWTIERQNAGGGWEPSGRAGGRDWPARVAGSVFLTRQAAERHALSLLTTRLDRLRVLVSATERAIARLGATTTAQERTG